MNYLKNIVYHLTFIIIYIHSTSTIRNKDLFVSSTGLTEAAPHSVGLQFYSVLNNTSNQDYFVELLTDQCCIDSGESLDCDSLDIIGECSEIVRKGKTKTFTLVAPVLDPFQRKGYCVIHLDSRPIDKRNKIMRDVIKIDFDSAVAIKNNYANFEELIKRCKNLDEDPFNDCNPVNCDSYYNGKKPLFDKQKKKCTEAPNCDTNESEPKIYDPISNRCIDPESINMDDIDYIKSGINKRDLMDKARKVKDVIIVEARNPIKFDDATHSLVQNHDVVKNITKKIKAKAEMLCLNDIIDYLLSNKYVICILALVIFLQCCFICIMVYRLTINPTNFSDKTVERKYFNYRQDVSVTTPLIATSNINTETTEFDYVSESNVDKRIKCYKACQKKTENDTKISLSDDILSKCLNRRVWNTKPMSDTLEPNIYNDPSKTDWNMKVVDDHENQIKEMAKVSTKSVEEIKSCETKSDFDENESSEKLIQCHDYNIMVGSRNFRDGRSEDIAPSISTEKGAQACFSNDSVDDFLSERGMIFLAGEDLSKYSFASNSEISAGRSSKTSKNNIVKNVLSYLIKKSKVFTSSDPGVSKKTDDKSLELIHMSKATVYSSSASEYKQIKGIKLPKESRSSIF